jgi:hypothetical protein
VIFNSVFKESGTVVGGAGAFVGVVAVSASRDVVVAKSKPRDKR